MNARLVLVKRLSYHHEMRVSRTDQKARTREALVAAARELLRSGVAPPTVAEAAEAARVSRATAYRYFPTHEALLLEAGSITPATQPVEALLESLPSEDVEERLAALLDRFNPIVFAEELSMRTALRTYQDTWLAARARGDRSTPVREGRRMRWLDKVLAPARRELTDAQWRRLRYALSLTFAIDAMVVMKDVCRIESDKEALAVLRWAALALLRAGLAEAKATRKKPSKRR